jgi:hypothetical protein
MILPQALVTTLAPVLFAWSFTGGIDSPVVDQDSVTPLLSSPSHILAVTTSAKSPTEDYLPRRLYPGTYNNYCGPTPEVDRVGGCVAHGWHGDKPLDAVDDACRLHDVSYCQCESQLLQRQHQHQKRTSFEKNKEKDDSIPMLSSLTALRFATRPAMNSLGIDQEYYQCINKADRQLIARGLAIRAEQQRTACSTDPNLAWFCGRPSSGRDTLKAFEKVSLAIFLRSLDDDDGNLILGRKQQSSVLPSSSVTLSTLEAKRQQDLQRELQSGKSLAEAASSSRVVQDEEQMIQLLRIAEEERSDDI